jgi:TolA-binding protein
MRRKKSLQRSLMVLALASRFAAGQDAAPVETIPAPDRSDLKTETSEEIRLMQLIEPGFIPKSDAVIQLFMLQKVVNDNDLAIKAKKELKLEIRAIFSKKFRENLVQYSAKRIGDIEARYEQSSRDLIIGYEQALKYNPHHPLYTPDALYMLGLNYFEMDEKIYFEKLAQYNEARLQGREDIAYPEENFGRTIEAYERLIRDFPDYRHMDGVYYLLGLALWYEGDFSHSVRRFQDLINKFPRSEFVGEVWFRLGEYFYDMEEYEEAIDAYAMVIKNPKSPLYKDAVYKTAWSYYQKNQYNKAIKNFVQVVALSEKEKLEGSTAGMREEAIRYIVRSFGEILYIEAGTSRPKVKPAKTLDNKAIAAKMSNVEREYAERMGLKLAKRVIAYINENKVPEYSRELLLETASQLLAEVKLRGAVLALQTITKLNESNTDNPRIDAQIVDILTEGQHLEEAREQSRALIRRYGKDSAWYKSMAGNFEAQSYAREAVRDAILGLAVFYHKTAKELKETKPKESQAHFKEAALLYSSYVKEYPERDDTPRAIFYFAESVYELNRFKTALEAYQLLKDYPLPLADNLRREAIYNIVFTFRHVVELEAKEDRFKDVDFDALTSKQKGLEKADIPLIGQKYLSAIDEFLVIAPDDEQVPVLLFHAAAIYYVYGHSDEAMRRFSFIIDTYPSTAAALVASRLVLDDAIAMQDWTRVTDLAGKFRTKNLGGKADEFARIEGNARFKMARSVFEEANELQKNNQLTEAKAKYKESAELFANLLKEDPTNPYADAMLFNSARAIAQSGLMSAALPLYREVYSKYPKSEFAKDARFQEALALEKMLKFSAAALAYDGIIKADPKSEAAADAMLNKALLYEAADDLNNAIDAFVVFAKVHPQRPEAPDALLTAGAIYKKQGKISQQIAMLEQFIKQYKKDADKIPAVIEAYAEVGDSYGDLAKASKAPAEVSRYQKAQVASYKAAVALYSPNLSSPLAAFFAAKAQLAIEKSEQESFKKMTINGRSGKAQADQLTAMMKKLAELSAKNEAIIKAYAQPVWNAESLYRIGALYEHLARTMIKAPCPADVEAIDDYACDEYTVLLEDKAAVLEGKSLSAYVQAYDIAMSAYDAPPDLVGRIQSALNRLKPGKYQRVGDVIEKPETGAFYGQGRMLSNGRMASSLHPAEGDPDVKKVAPEASDVPTNEEAPKEEELLEEIPVENDELVEDFE